MPTTRGNAISAYSPAFSKGAKIYGANIQSGVVTSAHIADLGVVGGEIAAGAVTSAKIGTNAVTNVKISAKAVTSAKIGVSAVQNTNIAANAIRAGAISARAVTSAKLGVSAVQGANIGVGAVKNGSISAKAVTSAKFRAAFLSGTLVSAKKVFAVAHGLAVKPKFVVVCAINTLTQSSAAQNNHVALATSASTSTNIYLVASGTQTEAKKYSAWVQL